VCGFVDVAVDDGDRQIGGVVHTPAFAADA
jgi:hypothetical protein